MGQRTLRDVLRESKEGRKILKKYDKNLDDYEQSELDQTVNDTDRNREIAAKISKLMLKDPRVNHELKNQLTAAHALKKGKLSALRMNASQKTKWHQLGAKKQKRAAQNELDKIRKTREKNLHSGYKRISKTSYSEGQKGSNGKLANKISDLLFGAKIRRTAAEEAPEGAKEIDYTYNLKDGNKGHLHGYILEPAKDKLTDDSKVVLVFGGGGSPAARYVKEFKDVYLNAGCRIVVMDYRGFGESVTENPDGEEIDFQLGERSLYTDGEAMLSYVQNELHCPTSQIILHGYSLGGAVASKVAANLAERNAVRRKNAKIIKEKHRLGGLVLQSPIGTNYKMSSNYDEDMSKVKRTAYGFLSWMFSGGFNTISHMKRLHKYDPKLPVHLVSGSRNLDELNLERSGILANNPYPTATTFTTDNGHKGVNIVKEDQGLQDLINKDRTGKKKKELNTL